MIPLKEATATKHKQAERLPFNSRMFKGELSKEEYALYLNQQAEIFKAIEAKGLPHEGLSRVGPVQEDIDELKAQGVDAHYILSSTKAYVDYLAQLSYEEILPHVYLNYLAIMFGGQMMKKAVPSSGKMYDFVDMREGMQAIRTVQKDEWADEVNTGFDFIIAKLEELEIYSKEQKLSLS